MVMRVAEGRGGGLGLAAEGAASVGAGEEAEAAAAAAAAGWAGAETGLWAAESDTDAKQITAGAITFHCPPMKQNLSVFSHQHI